MLLLTHFPWLPHLSTFAITPHCIHTTKHLLHTYTTLNKCNIEITLQGLPYDATTAMALVYGGLLALMGVLISWAAPACNNPIFAEIVPPHLRNMIYSFDRSDLHSTFLPSWLLLCAEVAGLPCNPELCSEAIVGPHQRLPPPNPPAPLPGAPFCCPIRVHLDMHPYMVLRTCPP